MDKKKALVFFALIPFLMVLVQPAYAEIEKGKNFDRELIEFDPATNSKTFKWTSHPERILDDSNNYRDFIFTNDTNYLQVETAHGSIRLDKTSCAFSFYPKGRTINQTPLFSDSIIARMAVNGTSNWQNVNAVNNEACQPSWDGTTLQAKKHKPGTGTLFYRYVNTGEKWKTELEVINLSALTNRKFAFTQTIDLNRDTVKFGNTTRNIDNYHNQTFNRQWIESHQSKLLNLLNGINYDFDLAYDKLWSITVYDTGVNSSKLAFDFAKDSTILLPNENRIYDPTFGYTAGTNYRAYTSSGAGASCPAAAGTDTAWNIIIELFSTASDNCSTSTPRWDISSLPTTITVSSTKIRYDVDLVSNMGSRTCEWNPVTIDPSTGTAQQIFDDAQDGTAFTTETDCRTASTDKIVTLGSSANSDIASARAASRSWWAVGFAFTSYARDATSSYSRDNTGGHSTELEIIYTTGNYPNAPRDLTVTPTGKTTAYLDWTQPDLKGGTLTGYQANKTTPIGTPLTVMINSTTNTDYTATGLTACTQYTFRVATQTGSGYNASGNKVNATTACFDPPAKPTLTATAESDTAVRFTSVNGTDGDFNISWYAVRCVKNSATSWTNHVTNSSIISPRVFLYSSITIADTVTCQWRDGSPAGWGPWSDNATGTPTLDIIQSQRGPNADRLTKLAAWFDSMGGVYMGMSLFPFLVLMIGLLARPRTTGIFVIITLSFMGILHGSGYYQYPDWYWALSLLFGIVIVLARYPR